MNKNEYLQRIFESQINSLKKQIEYTEKLINDLEVDLKERKLDLKGTKDLLIYAEEEMRKLR